MITDHNLNAHLLGTGEFSFAEGATTLAAANLIGFRDFGNMMTYSIQPTNTKVEHKGSYRGTKRTDKIRVTETKLLYQLKMDEWTMQNLLYVYYGDTAGNLTQTIKTGNACDAFLFGSTATFTKGNWYDLTVSGVRVRNITAAIIASSNTPVATAGDSSTDFFTTTGHGLLNGAKIAFVSTGTIAAISVDTEYFIVNKTTDTFQVSLTAGGTPIDYASNGSGTTYVPVLKAGVDFELDAVTGRVRFLTTQAGSVYPNVTAPAITATDPGALRLITPLTTAKRSGIGRLIIFDDKKNDQVATEHDGFGCDISLTGNVDGGADTFSDFTLEVLITSPVGVVGARELSIGTA